MAGPQHRTPEYRAARRTLGQQIAHGQGWCVQGICMKATRHIPPGTAWDVAHDDSGTVILGAAHATCNRADGGRRRHRASTRRRWTL
jgi:hypothetical protein